MSDAPLSDAAKRRTRLRDAIRRRSPSLIALAPIAVFILAAVVGHLSGPTWVLCLLGMSVVLFLMAMLWQVLGDHPVLVVAAGAVGAVLVVALFLEPGWVSLALFGHTAR